VSVNGQDRLLLSSVVGDGFGILNEGDVQLVVMDDDSLLIANAEKGVAVQLQFP